MRTMTHMDFWEFIEVDILCNNVESGVVDEREKSQRSDWRGLLY